MKKLYLVRHAEEEGHDLYTEFHNCAISELVFDDASREHHGRVLSWARWDHLSGEAAVLVRGVMDT